MGSGESGFNLDSSNYIILPRSGGLFYPKCPPPPPLKHLVFQKGSNRSTSRMDAGDIHGNGKKETISMFPLLFSKTSFTLKEIPI